jgi:hypothetical protein
VAITLSLSVFAQAPANPNPTPGQAPVKKNPLLPYAGNWICTLDNKPWFVLSLNLVGEQFSGSLQRVRSFDLNDSGEVKRVSEEFEAYQLTDATLNPEGLLLTLKDPDTQQTQRYQMKLTGDSTAEIKMLAMTLPPGMPKPKPWKLTKAARSSKAVR